MSELGVKRLCPKCGSKFYDLSKNPAHCPKCGHEFNPTVVTTGKGTKKTKAVKPQKPAKAVRLETNEDEIDLSEFETPDGLESGDDELENLDDLDELGDGELEALPEVGEREREDDVLNSDDGDDDAFIEEMEDVETLVDKPEDEDFIDEEEE